MVGDELSEEGRVRESNREGWKEEATVGVQGSRGKEEGLGQAISLGDQQAIGSEADSSVSWVVIKQRQDSRSRLGKNGKKWRERFTEKDQKLNSIFYTQ